MAVGPNVLLITTDQQRSDALGICGNPVIQTPHLDALAQQGIRFSHAFSPTPICIPSRYAIMTGRYPFRWGMRANSGVIPADVPTLPQALGEAGYRTALIGKAHFTGPEDACREMGIPTWRYPYGFDEMALSEEGRQWNDGGDDYEAYLKSVGWHGYERAHGVGNNDARTSPSPLPEEHTQTAWCARSSIEWMQRHVASNPDRPFFLWCSFVKPHAPYDPPAPWDRMYDPRSMPPPVGSAEGLAELSPHYQRIRYEHHLDSLSDQAVLRARAYYYALCSQIDHEVGRLVEALDALRIRDNTVILFCSDHGDHLGDHGLFFKTTFFDGSWRVPLFVCGPGVSARGESDALVNLTDVFPTLLELAGAPVPEGVQGESLLGPSQRTEVIGSIHREPNRILTVRDRERQYVWHQQGGHEELYDLTNDPNQEVNLAGRPDWASVKAELRDRLRAWFAQRDPSVLDGNGDLLSFSSEAPTPRPLQTKLGLRPH